MQSFNQIAHFYLITLSTCWTSLTEQSRWCSKQRKNPQLEPLQDDFVLPFHEAPFLRQLWYSTLSVLLTRTAKFCLFASIVEKDCLVRLVTFSHKLARLLHQAVWIPCLSSSPTRLPSILIRIFGAIPVTQIEANCSLNCMWLITLAG